MKKLLFLCVFVFSCANVYAISFSDIKADIYGQLYLDTFYQHDSREMHFLTDLKNSDASTFDVDLTSLSRLGLNLELGNLKGTVEVGLSSLDYLRLYYVSYDFGNFGSLLFGQDWTIAGYSFGQVSMGGNGLCDYGAVNDWRRPQLKYGIAGFEFAIVHSGSDSGLGDTIITTFETERNQYLPRFELAYNYENSFFSGKVFGSYGYYSMKIFEDPAIGQSTTYSASSYHVGIGGKFTISDAFVQFTGYYGVNMYLSSALTGGILGAASGVAPTFTNGGIDTVQSAGGAIAVGYTFAGIITPQIGFGYNASFNKIYTDNSNDSYAAFINAAIQFNKWLSFTPEVVYIDEMSDGYGNSQGKRLIAGGQFLFAF